MAAPSLQMVQTLIEAGATPASAARAAEVLARGGSYDDARLEIVLVDELGADEDSDRDEVFLPEMLISRDYGGGGNRTRVTCQADSPLSSENASGSSDDEPSPPLVTPLRSLPSVELASPSRSAEA